MKRIVIIITTLFSLTAVASAESNPKRILAILEGSKVCEVTDKAVECMTGFMAALDATASAKADPETTGETMVDLALKTCTGFNDSAACVIGFMAAVAIDDKSGQVHGGLNKANRSVTIESLKKQFKQESLLLRKRTQYALLEYGYYKSTIDGYWGQNTQNALLNYIKKEKLENLSPNDIFTRLRKDMGWSDNLSSNYNNTNNEGLESKASSNKDILSDVQKLIEKHFQCQDHQFSDVVLGNSDLFVRIAASDIGPPKSFVPKNSKQRYFMVLVQDHNKRVLPSDRTEVIDFLLACKWDFEQFKTTEFRDIVQIISNDSKQKALKVLDSKITYKELMNNNFDDTLLEVISSIPIKLRRTAGREFNSRQKKFEKKFTKEILQVFEKNYDITEASY